MGLTRIPKSSAIRGFAILLLLLSGLTGCARHNEDQLRTLLSRWFSIGDVAYFKSRMSCTAAMFETRSSQVKSALRIEAEMTRALRNLERTGIMALSLDEKSPDQVFVEITNANRSLGLAVQEAALMARDCMDVDTKGAFHAALSNVESLFVWHKEEAALIVFNPQQRQALFVSREAG